MIEKELVSWRDDDTARERFLSQRDDKRGNEGEVWEGNKGALECKAATSQATKKMLERFEK